jgi:two-component system chemotaxis response regulator CheB
MAIRVLVVDDSGFFRRRVTEMLNSDARLQVVGAAEDGAQAVEMTARLKPDVITMDIEMPVMDGITAVRRIMAAMPTPILMFSSLTTDGAKPTLDALDAGAVDYLPKKFEDISRDRDEAKRQLCERVYAIGSGRRHQTVRPHAVTAATAVARVKPRPVAPAAPVAHRRGTCKIVAIGTSTGGPVALQEVLTKLPANFPLPLVLVQHMPGSFTPAFAQRLNQQCAITVKEAADGDPIEAGVALLAPGGKQMLVEQRAGRAVIRITESAPGQTYKPSVDTTFTSLSRSFPGQVLAVVLTGMGADGREGARLLKQGGSTVWAQNEATCVVYGMPAAVVEAGLADQVLALHDIGPALAQRV